jgi:hypothetical protein
VPKHPDNACPRCQDGAISARDVIIQKEAFIRKLQDQLKDERAHVSHLNRKIQVMEYERKQLLEKHAKKFDRLHKKINGQEATEEEGHHA